MLQYQAMKKLILTAILGLTSSSLFATTIRHQGLDWNRAMGIEIEANGQVRNVNAGVGSVRVNGSALLDVFCVNLFQGITLYQSYSAASVAPAAYDSDGGAAAWLMQTLLPGLHSAVEGAALQLAIWDVIHDGGDGFDAGLIQSSLHTNADVLSLASGWVSNSRGMNGTAAFVFTAAPNARPFQQQMYLAIDCNPPSDVPEPGTTAMLAIGCLGVFVGSWRRKRQAE
jgi:PEP-CTERM motif